MPGIPLPAFCTNPACGTFFIAGSIFGAPEGTSHGIDLTNVGVGPCPSCGGFGSVPDGVYSPLEARIRDPLAAERVSRLLGVLRQHVSSPTSMADLMNDMSSAGLTPSNWKPKNLDEALKLFGAIMVLLAFLYTVYKGQKPEPAAPALSVEMREVIEMILDSSQHASPPISQSAPLPTSLPVPADAPNPPPTK